MGQGNGFEKILTAFVDQYGLPRSTVLEVIVNTLSHILGRWHRMEVMVIYSEGRLQAVGYSPFHGGLKDHEDRKSVV